MTDTDTRRHFTSAEAWRSRDRVQFTILGENFVIPGRVDSPTMVREIVETAQNMHNLSRRSKGLPPLYTEFGGIMREASKRGHYQVNIWCD